MRHVHSSVSLTDRSSVGEARRIATQAAQSLGFDEARRNDIGIVATEAATNVVLHAKSGEFLVCPSSNGVSSWLDLFAMDAGPGMANISRAMEDGYSTVGTAGQGLGAIARLSDRSSLYSAPGKGTIYWSRFASNPAAHIPPFGVINLPVKGETVCGDGYIVVPGASRSLYVVVDGLGHGLGAAEAAEEALAVTKASQLESASTILSRTHDALKKTRGAAMSVAIADHDRKILTYAGIGNVSGILITGGLSRSMVSQNGTLGAALPRPTQEFTYPVERNTLLVMFSDGLTTKAGLSTWPGMQGRNPPLIAALLYREFTRRRDDATVLVARMEDEGG